MRCGRQDHVMRLDARKLFEDRARRISKACAALPHLEALPQHKGKKADEDMGLNAVLVLMPDRTDVELIFLDAESGLGLGELDIGLPELLIAPIVDVRAQQIGALMLRPAGLRNSRDFIRLSSGLFNRGQGAGSRCRLADQRRVFKQWRGL